MSNRGASGGGNNRTRASLGMLSGRLRGGFLASTLPSFRSSSSSSSTQPPSTSDSDDTGTILTLSVDQDLNASNDQSVGLTPTMILDTLRAIKATTTRLERRFQAIEQQQIKLADSMQELQSLMKNQEKDNFSIKGSTYELPLKEELARLFCLSLKRDPKESDIQAAVVKVMGRVDPRNRHKVQAALKFCKNKLTEYRSEERRKVLGQAPCRETCHLSTPILAQQIMHKMHAPADVDEEVYIRHLAIFRKFVRLTMNNKEATYTTFRDWLGLATIEEDTWSKIMEEDNCFDYANKGVGRDEIDVAGEILVASNNEDANEDDYVDED